MRAPSQQFADTAASESKPAVLRDWWLAALLIFAVVLAYQPVWHAGFIWDDDRHVTRPELRSLSGLERIWLNLGATQQYYPFVHSVFWFEHRLWGDATPSYHCLNILLHALSALLLVKLLRQLQIPGAWLAGALFALHPVEVESVAWISELKNTLSSLFYLTAALAYLEFDRTRSWRHYAVALILFALGLMSKTVIASLPGALLVVFWWQRGKLSWRRDVAPVVPFFAIGMGAGLLTAWVERKFIHAEGAEFDFSMVERGLIAGRAIWFYLGKIFWPADLVFIYPRWKVSQTVWWQYMFPAAALLLLGILVWLARRWRGPLAAFLFFAGTLFPALGFLNIYPFRYSFVADHFQYLASIGPMTLAAVLINMVLRGKRTFAEPLVSGVILLTLAVLTWRQWQIYASEQALWVLYFASLGPLTFAAVFIHWLLRDKVAFAKSVVSGVILLTLAVLTWRQCHIYSNDEILWRATLARDPRSIIARDNLSGCLLGKHQPDEAIPLCQSVLAENPDNVTAQFNMGWALQQKGQWDEALAHFEKALQLQPARAGIAYSMGETYLKKGRMDDAVRYFDKAIELQPDYSEAYCNLGYALLRQGHQAEAMAAYGKALELNPHYALAHNDLGNILLQLRRTDEALAHFQQAAEFEPGFAEAHFNIAEILASRGQLDNAARRYKKALETRPDLAEAHYKLGNIYAQQGHAGDAVSEYQDALKIRADYLPACNNLAWLLATSPEASLRNGSRAVELAQRTDELSHESNPVVLRTLAAAYAETGNYPKAVETIDRALALAAKDPKFADALAAQKKLYQSGSPFRESPPH